MRLGCQVFSMFCRNKSFLRGKLAKFLPPEACRGFHSIQEACRGYHDCKLADISTTASSLRRARRSYHYDRGFHYRKRAEVTTAASLQRSFHYGERPEVSTAASLRKFALRQACRSFHYAVLLAEVPTPANLQKFPLKQACRSCNSGKLAESSTTASYQQLIQHKPPPNP